MILPLAFENLLNRLHMLATDSAIWRYGLCLPHTDILRYVAPFFNTLLTLDSHYQMIPF